MYTFLILTSLNYLDLFRFLVFSVRKTIDVVKVEHWEHISFILTSILRSRIGLTNAFEHLYCSGKGCDWIPVYPSQSCIEVSLNKTQTL